MGAKDLAVSRNWLPRLFMYTEMYIKKMYCIAHFESRAALFAFFLTGTLFSSLPEKVLTKHWKISLTLFSSWIYTISRYIIALQLKLCTRQMSYAMGKMLGY